MNHIRIIQDFIKFKQSIDDVPATGFPFITISREAGAGANTTAKTVLSDFEAEPGDVFQDWHVFDRDLCEVIAQKEGLQTSMEELLSEEYKPEFEEFMYSLIAGESMQYKKLKETFKIVRVLATLGKVIIIGRAASFVAKGLPNGIHIRLVAGEASKVKRMMRKFGISKKAALKMMKKHDSDRSRMVKSFFNKDIADPENYDAVFNTDIMSPHEISACIIQMVKARMSAAKKKTD